MIHWFVHEFLVQFLITGFIYWRIGRKWLYPNMDKALTGELGKINKLGARLKIIWQHNRTHGNIYVLKCMNTECLKL